MTPLPSAPLPLPNQPADAYSLEEEYDVSEDGNDSVSAMTKAFNTGIDNRDKFLGRKRCVICGLSSDVVLRRCHIIETVECGNDTEWYDLKKRGWIPPQATGLARHDLRNGLRLCRNHGILFNGYAFFLRFFPNTEKFVFINYSGNPDLQECHGKAVALDIKDPYAPLPSLFILYELRVRGFNPFEPVGPAVPNDTRWQD